MLIYGLGKGASAVERAKLYACRFDNGLIGAAIGLLVLLPTTPFNSAKYGCATVNLRKTCFVSRSIDGGSKDKVCLFM